MKFECKTEVLQQIIFQVGKARSKSSQQINLQDIHLELDDHLLTVRATNLEIVCEKSVPVKGIVNGKCLIQGEILTKVLSTLTKNNTSIICELLEGTFTITSGKDVTQIKVNTYEPFLTLPLKGDEIASFPKDSFLSLLRDVSFCAATTDIKPDIASVYLYNKDDFVYAVATDSYRLAESYIHHATHVAFSVLIPQKYIQDIINILDQEKEDIKIYQSEHVLTFEVGSLTLAVHTVLGQFPDYRQLFPKEFTTIATVKKEELHKALSLSTIFAEQYTTTKINLLDDELIIDSKNEMIGSMHHTINSTKKGEGIEVSYNTRYFLDAFPHLEGNDVIMSFTTKNRPAFLQGNKRTNFVYLLMPIMR